MLHKDSKSQAAGNLSLQIVGRIPVEVIALSTNEPTLYPRFLPIGRLVLSNVFMTVARCGHLKFKHIALPTVIAASWGIASFEYCLMVPANRLGGGIYSATQLKIIQEVITLTVFSGFALMYLGERIRWDHLAAFACILGAVAFTFLPKE